MSVYFHLLQRYRYYKNDEFDVRALIKTEKIINDKTISNYSTYNSDIHMMINYVFSGTCF